MKTKILDNQRIYVVVAESVQIPVVTMLPRSLHTPSYVNVTQPAGRLGAQVGHVVGKMRHELLRKRITAELERKRKGESIQIILNELIYHPVTTIVLAARDSKELEHVFALLRRYSVIPVYEFMDEQPDYGEDVEVRTAICTEPADPKKAEGILDYLPLWTPDRINK